MKDRKGHDFRYAIDNTKIKKLLKIKYKNNFNFNLNETFNYYSQLFFNQNS